MSNIPEIPHKERVKSLIETRLNHLPEKIDMSKQELAELILKEIDYATGRIDNADIEDIEEQFSDE